MSQNILPELQQLLELPLTKTTRLGQVQFFHFGKAQVQNAAGLILDVGAWTLEVSCFWQLEEGDEVIIANHEVEIPRSAGTFSDPAFDPLVPGNNLRDRKLQELIKQQPPRVWQVSAFQEGDLVISLDGDRVLHVKPSFGVVSGAQSYWRLFCNTGSKEELTFGEKGFSQG